MGAISPLKPKTVENDEEQVEESKEDEDGFQLVSKILGCPDYLPKEEIHRNITAILDGFKPKKNKERKQLAKNNSIEL